ncbi:MAG TPA: FAD-dependent oxidoreductase, partial [Acidimicrobiales bacterium]|nr:FAD-dependent oxidoreductase [Acidimicrobiales bacterium]
ASPIVNVHLVFDRTVTDLPMVAAVGSPVQFVFDRTRSAGLDRGQYLAVSLSGADAYVGRRPEELVRGFAEALADLFPAAGRARLVDGAVSREHAATFRARPGTAALRPPATTSLPGLFLAGAWCATGWPATMEGAARSGVDAARQALGAGGSTDRTDRTLQEAPA